MFTNLKDDVLIKRDGEVSGQHAAIENCQSSVLLLLDNLASVTVDDCKDCLIALGPCQGSIFIRDCENCVFLAACQQFRTRGSLISIHLFCSTAPIIEETKAKIWPLEINYPSFEDQLKRVDLAGKQNVFGDVQDFTPDISELQIENESVDLKMLLEQTSFLNGIDKLFEKENVQFGK